MTPLAAQVYVALDLDGVSRRAARAYVTERRGVVSVVLDYDAGYLSDPHGYSLSPDLSVTTSRHSVAGLPGSFADTAPDRWGRNLIAKRIRADARSEGRQPGSISELEYLLEVSDETRRGALRFALTQGGPYLSVRPDVPKLVALPRLLRAAETVAAERDDDMAAVKELLDAGSASLGGARPKASVRDGGRLLIAKFPHRGDEWDVMAWEKTALDLAERCGIRVPLRQVVDVGGRKVLLRSRAGRAHLTRRLRVSARDRVPDAIAGQRSPPARRDGAPRVRPRRAARRAQR